MAKSRKSEDERIRNEAYRYARKDPITGQLNLYFPMEVTDPSDRMLAREYNFEICRARLGYRKFEAVMMPCKDKERIHGMDVFIDTPIERQLENFKNYAKEELAEQDRMKNDGRCQIITEEGVVKRCPREVPNPNYVPGGKEKKYRIVKCEGCPYEEYKQAHTYIPLSALDHVGDDGLVDPFEPTVGNTMMDAVLYELWSKELTALTLERCPKLAPQMELKLQELNNSDVARELGKSTSTITSRAEKLKDLAREFMDTIVRP